MNLKIIFNRKVFWILKKVFFLLVVLFALYGVYRTFYTGADYCVLLNMKDKFVKCDCDREGNKNIVKVVMENKEEKAVDKSNDASNVNNSSDINISEAEQKFLDQNEKKDIPKVQLNIVKDVDNTEVDSNVNLKDKSVFEEKESDQTISSGDVVQNIDIEDLKELDVIVKEDDQKEIIMDDEAGVDNTGVDDTETEDSSNVQ